MSHSLRAKLKVLRYKGIITDKDCDRLRKALDNENVLDKIKAEIMQYNRNPANYPVNMISIHDILQIIDKYREVNE